MLARIHRLTIGRLRREIEPVTAAQYVAFLQRWQHVAPASRLHGIDGTLQVIRQLEGYEIPAVAWEAQILPARDRGIPLRVSRSALLRRRRDVGTAHAASGARTAPVGRSGPRAADAARADRAVPARQRRRADRARASATSRRSRTRRARCCEQIEELRAPFFAEILRSTKRLPSEVEEALWQLVAAGLVTADGFDALRSLSDAKRRLGEKGLRARPRSSSGRWTLLAATTERIDREAFARRLLARWGVVFRDVIARESLAPPWRELLIVLRRMEARGEIRGGRFVAGFVGEQFALPEAIEALRAARRTGAGTGSRHGRRLRSAQSRRASFCPPRRLTALGLVSRRASASALRATSVCRNRSRSRRSPRRESADALQERSDAADDAAVLALRRDQRNTGRS